MTDVGQLIMGPGGCRSVISLKAGQGSSELRMSLKSAHLRCLLLNSYSVGFDTCRCIVGVLLSKQIEVKRGVVRIFTSHR